MIARTSSSPPRRRLFYSMDTQRVISSPSGEIFVLLLMRCHRTFSASLSCSPSLFISPPSVPQHMSYPAYPTFVWQKVNLGSQPSIVQSIPVGCFCCWVMLLIDHIFHSLPARTFSSSLKLWMGTINRSITIINSASAAASVVTVSQRN